MFQRVQDYKETLYYLDAIRGVIASLEVSFAESDTADERAAIQGTIQRYKESEREMVELLEDHWASNDVGC